MQTDYSKIDAAADASSVIDRRIGEAVVALQRAFTGRIFNGHGVYSDPSRQRQALAEACYALREAKDLFDTVDWPDAADYDAAED